ncbi:hypothetical protein D0869_00383 [Hortaea werneckii]|uniref:RBR-type E3 ubiquitin transferase n=1 Tax=Hortaea werneckii TaxID=91943 RepID=A0A3M6XH12_HORWE|nr:hypothetical protein KC324_g16759 [Hortaea werneckii]KAI7533165.1 hypothetical protein KC316_g16836 [Hortaea werneckii]RMX90085.1 hypothetical protein D0869_00383 [Hortaea werneckii]RMY08705.1 hypothetical protein D0868_04649 [Hortaea werneckii]
MANLIPHWVEVRILDEMDEGTARVIIDTWLEELEALADTGDPDTLFAREAYIVELKRYRGSRASGLASSVPCATNEPAEATTSVENGSENAQISSQTREPLEEYATEPLVALPPKHAASPAADVQYKRQEHHDDAIDEIPRNVNKRAAPTDVLQRPVKRQRLADDSSRESSSDDPASTVECTACCDTTAAEDTIRAPCDHAFCDQCLKRQFEGALRDEALYPPGCCKRPIGFLDVKRRLPADLAEIFEAKIEELDSKNRIYCHVPTCSAFIGVDHRNESVATCPACGKETCVKCKAAKHDGDCPEDKDLSEVLTLAKQEGWQKCPGCSRVLELARGCHHMTCKCKSEFCYICGTPWRNCKCTLWFEHRLLDRAETLAGRGFANGDVQEAARQLRVNYQCAHFQHAAMWERIGEPDFCEDCGMDMGIYIMQCKECRLRACLWCSGTKARRGGRQRH